MEKNSINSIFESLNKIYQLFCKKIFLNSCYIFFTILIVLSLIFLFITIGTNGDSGKWSIWIGLSLLLVFLISFYIFEFIRRRCKNELASKFNIKNLYEKELINNKMIDCNFNHINLKQEFIKFYNDSLLLNYENSTIYLMNDCYSFFINDKNYVISSCFINNYNKSVHKQDDLQLIISTPLKNINVEDLYIVPKREDDSILELRKYKDINNYSIYSNNNISDNLINKITKNLLKKNESTNLDFRIKDNTLYYIFKINNRLNIEASDLKLYKNNMEKIESNWSNNLNIIKQILTSIKDF